MAMSPNSPRSPRDPFLRRGILGSYNALRLGLALLGLALPVVLYLGGKHWDGLALQGSMSAYYHANSANVPALGVMRDEFVGSLFAVGFLMYAYRGLSLAEEIALDVGALCALGVALFPTEPSWIQLVAAPEPGFTLTAHGAFAVSFFLCIAYVCIFCASDTLKLIGDARARARYRFTYVVLGTLMVAMPAAVLALHAQGALDGTAIFWVEAIGIYVFAIYWLVKSREISRSDFDVDYARGEVELDECSFAERMRFKTSVARRVGAAE